MRCPAESELRTLRVRCIALSWLLIALAWIAVWLGLDHRIGQALAVAGGAFDLVAAWIWFRRSDSAHSASLVVTFRPAPHEHDDGLMPPPMP